MFERKIENVISKQLKASAFPVRAFSGLFILFFAVSGPVFAQNGTGVEANTDVSVAASPESAAQSSSGGNVFDFSNNSGRNTPPGPNLPSFAGGPCMGVSGGVSAAGPGFAIGGGRSYEDEACQRRNWVQTLIGVSQHMPEVEANELKRLAIAVMMQDEYLAPAFASLGYNPGNLNRATTQEPAQRGTPPEQRRARVSQAPPALAVISADCVVVVPESASQKFKELVNARGCRVELR